MTIDAADRHRLDAFATVGHPVTSGIAGGSLFLVGVLG